MLVHLLAIHAVVTVVLAAVAVLVIATQWTAARMSSVLRKVRLAAARTAPVRPVSRRHQSDHRHAA